MCVRDCAYTYCESVYECVCVCVCMHVSVHVYMCLCVMEVISEFSTSCNKLVFFFKDFSRLECYNSQEEHQVLARNNGPQ